MNSTLNPGDPGCWNSIGVWRTQNAPCPRLSEYSHCRNCPVFSAMARTVLAQPRPDGDISEVSYLLDNTDTKTSHITVFIFRLGDTHIAILSKYISEVAVVPTIAPVPNRGSGILKGVVNLAGELKLVVSLGKVLEILQVQHTQSRKKHAYERLVVLQIDQNEWVFPVSEVLGRFEVEHDAIKQSDTRSGMNDLKHVEAILEWQQQQVQLLALHSIEKTLLAEVSLPGVHG